MTTSPVWGAWMNLPSPMYMPTWWTSPPWANRIRSPGWSWLRGTSTPALTWSYVTRGIFTPTCANAYFMRLEQSKPTVFAPWSKPRLGPSSVPPPQEYGVPR